MPTLLSLSELDTICQNCVNAYDPNDPIMHALLYLMYHTGLRSNEVCEFDRFSDGPPGFFEVQLEKSNGTRLISVEFINPEIQQQIAALYGRNPYTYQALKYSVQKASPIIKFGSNVNRSAGHMFRYRFIKQLDADGLSNAQIRAITKQSSSEVVRIYIEDDIWQYP